VTSSWSFILQLSALYTATIQVQHHFSVTLLFLTSLGVRWFGVISGFQNFANPLLHLWAIVN